MSHFPLPAEVIYAPDYPLETPRLRLRPFNRGDVDAVFAYRRREDVAEYLFDLPMTHEECAEAVRGRVGQIAFAVEGDKILLAAERKEDGALIGEVSLIWRSMADGQAEIGYILNPDFQRQGYATEAAREALRFGFQDLALPEIVSFTAAINERSWRVMRRLGMHHYQAEDFDHPAVPEGDRLRRHVLYRLSRERWLAQSPDGGRSGTG